MPSPPNWIIGDSIDGTRQFLLRAVEPRFLAEICAEEDDDATLAPLCYTMADGRQLAHFVWLDPQPDAARLVDLLAAAATALRDYDEFTDIATNDGEEEE